MIGKKCSNMHIIGVPKKKTKANKTEKNSNNLSKHAWNKKDLNLYSKKTYDEPKEIIPQ